MMKMATGSENDSDDGGDIVTRTPAMPAGEETFSQPLSASKTSGTATNEAKKVKVSPSKTKATSTTPGSNSKSSSPTKNTNTKKTSTTPSKGKNTTKK